MNLQGSVNIPSILKTPKLPVIAAPLFIISVPDLVIAQCKAGVIGSFPALNAREKEGEPIELESLYKLLDNKNYELVHPAIALYSRLIYDEQKTGEWLRFATHFDSMIDDDKVPHLPKLGKALGKYFIETYWSYRKAVFHPHNDFIVKEK